MTLKIPHMPRIQCFSLFVTLLTAAFATAQFTDEINSNRPGKSYGAYSVGQSLFQVESGLYYISEDHALLETKSSGMGVDLQLRWGLFKEELEFIADLQYQADRLTTPIGSESRSALRQTVLGAKYLLYDPYKKVDDGKPKHEELLSWKKKHKFKWRQLIPSISAFAGFNLNFDNPFTFETDPAISPKVMIITQNQLSGGYVVVLNLIADRITSDFPSYGYILTITRGLNEKWSIFFENQGYKSDFYSDSILRGGAAYLMTETMQFDASVSTNMKDTPSVFYAGAGISWRFDENYKPVLIRSGKDKDKDGKDKDKKDKKKKKKRKDEVDVPAP